MTDRVRLEIGPLIAQAESLHLRVARELPAHSGIASLAGAVTRVAREADRVSQKLREPLGLHRLPAAFLGLALVVLVGWIYYSFLRNTTLTVAMPDRDAHELRHRVVSDQRLQFRAVGVPGSREALAEVQSGRVDLAFVQGGFTIPPNLPRLTTPHPELVLWFLRSRLQGVKEVRTVLTSLENEGSHTVARMFLRDWKIAEQVRFVHDWKALSETGDYEIPPEVDAVFVVKDPADEKTLEAAERLAQAGFVLADADLGARGADNEFLAPTTLPAGYLDSATQVPPRPVATYSVATYLVARAGLTPKMLAAAGHLLDRIPPRLDAQGLETGLNEASEVFQGVDAFLGILINLGLAFLALLGWEMLAYRRQFHELNSLISLISVHQSNKDVLGVADPQLRKDNLLYLSLCSDLLGLISMIAGYYTQENSSLLFHSLPEIIHQRCDGLKINIQLKILHATIQGVTLTHDPADSSSNLPVSRASSPGPPAPADP